jgi:hypothetical protein
MPGVGGFEALQSILEEQITLPDVRLDCVLEHRFHGGCYVWPFPSVIGKKFIPDIFATTCGLR